jgi:hypothetical protein
VILRRALFCLIMLTVAVAIAEVGSAQTVGAPTLAENDESVVTGLFQPIRFLEQEPRVAQQRPESVIKRLPPLSSDIVGASYESTEGGIPCDSSREACFTGSCQGANLGDCTCGCNPCQCPPPQAPCIECPHVSTLGGYVNLSIFGALKLDMLFNEPRPVSPGVPFFLFPGPPFGLNEHTVDIHARQTTLGAAFSGPQLGNFQVGGLFIAMLFNDAIIVDQYGFLPLQAYGELRNEDWRFAAGLQFDVFGPGLPTVLPFSALGASGNSGNSFRGQVRLERFLYPADDVQWTMQVALSEPIVTTIDPTFGFSEDNGWPNVEGRIALATGPVEGAGLDAKRPFEIGLSGVVGQIRNTQPPPVGRVVANVWGLNVDYRWKMTNSWGIAGEVYTGQTLGTYNGGILQNINVDTLEGIRSTGGWFETFVYWAECLHSHVGYGVDDPIARDVGALGRTYNSTIYGNLLWDIGPALRIGFELAWRETHYKSLLDNEGVGFHTQFQWTF